MKDQNKYTKRDIFKTPILTCALLIIGIVILVQTQWAFGLTDLSSFGKMYIPMAKDTALLFIIASLLLVLHIINFQKKYLQYFHVFLNCTIGLVSVLTILDILSNYQFGSSNFTGSQNSIRAGFVTGKMSILTCICFLLVCGSFFSIQMHAKKYSVFFSIAILLSCYVIFIGYANSVPLFYDSAWIPMSWPTSLAFIILAIGLLFTAGKEVAPLSYFIGSSTRARLLRSLLPAIFIMIQANNLVNAFLSKKLNLYSSMANSVIDIAFLFVVGIFISIVSNLIGGSIDKYIAEIQIVKEKLLRITEAVEQSPVSIMITNINGTIIYVNPKFEEISGYSFDEVIGKNPSILKSGYTSEQQYKFLWETITNGKRWQGVFYNKKKNGELYWEYATISPIKNEAGEAIQYLALKEDINDQKKVEAQLEKISWKQNHEIRAPLTTIMAIVAAMNFKISLEEKLALLNELDKPVKRLDECIRAIVQETNIKKDPRFNVSP